MGTILGENFHVSIHGWLYKTNCRIQIPVVLVNIDTIRQLFPASSVFCDVDTCRCWVCFCSQALQATHGESYIDIQEAFLHTYEICSEKTEADSRAKTAQSPKKELSVLVPWWACVFGRRRRFVCNEMLFFLPTGVPRGGL